MRFLFKLSFWLVIIIMVMPTDSVRQEKLYRTAEHAVSEAQSFCDKRPALCERGEVMWEQFKRKAQFLGGLASDVAMELMFPTPEPPARRKHADRLIELSGYEPQRSDRAAPSSSDQSASRW